MKRFSFILVACAAVLMTACNGRPSANLKSESDSVSYAIGSVIGSNLKPMLTYRIGIDSTYIEDVLKGISEGVKMADDTTNIARIVGMQLGMQLAQQLKGVGAQIMGEEEPVAYGSISNMMAGYIAAALGDSLLMTVEDANTYVTERIQKGQERKLEEEFGDNKIAGEQFMSEIAQKEGVQSLGNGVYYEVLVEGKGAVPADTSRVGIKYVGTLIDGTEFDKHVDDPFKSRPNQFIPGFKAALTAMPAGSKWKVYIPQDQAYGARQQGKINPFSTLIFDLELITVE